MNPEKYVKQSDMMNAIPDTIFYGDGLRKRFEELKTYTMPMSAIEYLIAKFSLPSGLIYEKIYRAEIDKNAEEAIALIEKYLDDHRYTCPGYLNPPCFNGSCPIGAIDEYYDENDTYAYREYKCDTESLRSKDKHLAAMFTSIAAQLGVCVFDENGKLREQPVIIKEMYNAFTSMIKNSAKVVKEIMDVFSDEEDQAKLDQLEKKREDELEGLRERKGDIYGS